MKFTTSFSNTPPKRQMNYPALFTRKKTSSAYAPTAIINCITAILLRSILCWKSFGMILKYAICFNETTLKAKSALLMMTKHYPGLSVYTDQIWIVKRKIMIIYKSSLSNEGCRTSGTAASFIFRSREKQSCSYLSSLSTLVYSQSSSQSLSQSSSA